MSCGQFDMHCTLVWFTLGGFKKPNTTSHPSLERNTGSTRDAWNFAWIHGEPMYIYIYIYVPLYSWYGRYAHRYIKNGRNGWSQIGSFWWLPELRVVSILRFASVEGHQRLTYQNDISIRLPVSSGLTNWQEHAANRLQQMGSNPIQFQDDWRFQSCSKPLLLA